MARNTTALAPIRNIGIMAHIDAGKTTTTEHILYYSGITHRMGEVDEGTAVMDWMSQEQDRGITITSAATTCYWKEHTINIIDTPGHVDFTAEVERSLRVLDGGIAIFDAVNGVEAQSEKVWKQADHYHVPRIVYINKMDRVGADFMGACRDIEERLGARLIPINIPVGSEQHFQGVIDLIEMHYVQWNREDFGRSYQVRAIPEEHSATAIQQRELMIDRLSSASEEITERYLNGQEIPKALLQHTLRNETIQQQVVPVCAGASLRNIGIQLLLDAVVTYLPAPQELPSLTVSHGHTHQPLSIERSPTPPLSALIFKIQNDREAGDMCFVRLYSGTIKNGEKLYNSQKKIAERATRLLKMHANHSAATTSLVAGEIGVIIGLRRAQTGDTLCDTAAPHSLESMDFPEPVLSMAIEPQAYSDRAKLINVLKILEREDPTFVWKDNADTGELLIAGMGELHLEVVVTRIIEEWRLKVRAGKPQVEHRGTVSIEYEHTEHFEQQMAGERQHIHIHCTVKPQPRGAGNAIELKLEAPVMAQWSDTVEEAIRDALSGGIAFGYPAVDVQVIIDEVRYQEREGVESAMRAAINSAINTACQKARPLLLSPVMQVDISTPKAHMGDMLTALNQRGALILAVESKPHGEQIAAEVALKELFGFSTVVRSATRGLGDFSMEFARYAASE